MSSRLHVDKEVRVDITIIVEVSITKIKAAHNHGRVCMMVNLSLIVAVRVVVDLLVQCATTRHQGIDLRRDQHLNHRAMRLQMLRLDQKILASLPAISEEAGDDTIHMADSLKRSWLREGLFQIER